MFSKDEIDAMIKQEGKQDEVVLKSILENELKERMKAKVYQSNWDNLRFKSIAQHRALADGDILQFDILEKRLISNGSMKGLALRSDSLAVYEKFEDNGYYESENLSMEDSKMLDNT